MDKLRLPDSDFALTTDALDFMQKAYNYLENISLIGGQSYMLSGGEESNGVAADGIVVLNGEVMPFKGGSVQTNIRVVTVTSDVSVGVAQRQQITKYAEFGTSTNPDDNYVWADLVKINTIPELMSDIDSLISFNGNLADTGWIDLVVEDNRITFPNYYFAKVRQYGKIVDVTIRAVYTSDANVALTLFSLPESISKPTYDTNISVNGRINSDRTRPYSFKMRLSPGGSIYDGDDMLREIPSGDSITIELSFTYTV